MASAAKMLRTFGATTRGRFSALRVATVRAPAVVAPRRSITTRLAQAQQAASVRRVALRASATASAARLPHKAAWAAARLASSSSSASSTAGKKAAAEEEYVPPGETKKIEKMDPMDVFNRIDANGDGVLSREEFKMALSEMQFAELHTTLSLLDKSLSRNELSRTDGGEEDTDGSIGTLLKNRIAVMADVTVSKIFPAGFGWQYFSSLADAAGYQSTDWTFFVYAGVGDGFGVFTGHALFSLLKKFTWDKGIDMAAQVQTGLLLGTAAFFSGTAWQPVVNTMSNAGYSFNQTMLGTTLVCATFFFAGLRVSRLLYGPLMAGVAKPTYANLKADAALSLAIGGATGCFVGTDISFADNWLRPIVGVEDGTSVLAASSTAGMSTALGFVTVQMLQNVTYPTGKAWLD